MLLLVHTVEARKLEYDPPLIPNHRKKDKQHKFMGTSSDTKFEPATNSVKSRLVPLARAAASLATPEPNLPYVHM